MVANIFTSIEPSHYTPRTIFVQPCISFESLEVCLVLPSLRNKGQGTEPGNRVSQSTAAVNTDAAGDSSCPHVGTQELMGPMGELDPVIPGHV